MVGEVRNHNNHNHDDDYEEDDNGISFIHMFICTIATMLVTLVWVRHMIMTAEAEKDEI